MKYDVVTIGDASEDLFIRPAEMRVASSRSTITGRVISFELGEKIPIESVEYAVGGSAANAAVGMVRLGFKTGIISALGTDFTAEKILNVFKNEGVDIDNINFNPKISSNFAVIIVAPDGERTILAYRGRHDCLALKLKKTLRSKWFFLTPIAGESDRVFAYLLSMAAEQNSRLAWNPGSFQIREGAGKYRTMLKNTSILFLNREEAIKFLHFPIKPKIEEVMKRFSSMGVKIVVITDGRNGAGAYDGEIFYHADIIKSAARVDATGAGDSFASGFLARLILEAKLSCYNKEMISEALKWGIVNSTSVITKTGAQAGLLTLSEIESAISAHPRLLVEVYN